MVCNLKSTQVATLMIGIVLMFPTLSFSESAIDLNQAKQYFEEARAICESDSGHLWGQSLCVPMMFTDRQTGSFVANENNQTGTLESRDGVFIGKLPPEIGAANTALDWEGKRWTMILWPLPESKIGRADLMLHESFHNIQPALGLVFATQPNAHLDKRDGRVWLQMEWFALRDALQKTGDERRTAIQDALLFRQYRRHLFTTAAKQECQMEMHEGLAQYTGHVLCGLPRERLIQLLGMQLDKVRDEESLVSSFAYWSGSAYGLLLDALGSNWRSGLTPATDIGLLVQKASGVSALAVTSKKAEQRMKLYGGDSVRTFEDQRATIRGERLQKYRHLFVEGPVLRLPLQQMQYTYDPSNICPLDTLGSVYPTMRISDLWGILNVQNGVLLSENMTKVTLAAPADTSARPVVGDGWVLELKPGWTIKPGERKGDLILLPDGSK